MTNNKPRFKRICFIVLDSVGIGALPDAPEFGDEGAHTLGHILEKVPHVKLPNMQKLGLGNIAEIPPLDPVDKPQAYYGKMKEVSAGKDTMTGHWELMGLKIDTPFNTYPDGFPQDLITEFEKQTGRKVICNKPASGTEVLDEYGEEQMKTGAWIVYTSADSVFQIAAHEDIIPLEELYKACKIARKLTLAPEHSVGRVIARPYVGTPGAFKRTSNRHDYAVKPPEPTVMNALHSAGYDVIAVGKINDIFDGEGVTEAYPTKSNEHGIEVTIQQLGRDFNGLLFTNLVDFDSLYGHRRDPEGYAGALEVFDQELPKIMERISEEDLLIISADHGNDPIHRGTDHTREYVPVLIYSPALKQPGDTIGVRETYSDLGATISDNFGATAPLHGESFLNQLK
ncbi:phosphopentomutase [Paenibacillus urinalis]|uniref:Phosphopentomutase n=1 Tax=Paenibacillus urinalis TaxID=521520 RepID=A0ABY7X598_9BACL|nr:MULTISPECIES: phosphopentomutase [Paenibacillus]WDH97343.1 phosphopentomutase [Paenibacillus urinalis]WDI01007.1 phosphopentomutase [Paenibacillus urinalis]GAK39944.1 phosphopentomutase [Paenibacillus sp. TCA20]